MSLRVAIPLFTCRSCSEHAIKQFHKSVVLTEESSYHRFLDYVQGRSGTRNHAKLVKDLAFGITEYEGNSLIAVLVI